MVAVRDGAAGELKQVDDGVRSTLAWLGALFGSMSLLALFYQATQISLVSVLYIFVGFYRSALTFLLGWAHRPIMDALHAVGNWVNWNAHFDSEVWRGLFVLNMAVISAFVRGQRRDVPAQALFALTVGGLVSLVNSVYWALLFDGSIPLPSPSQLDISPAVGVLMLIVAGGIPVFTMLAFEIGLTMVKVRSEPLKWAEVVLFEIEIFFTRLVVCGVFCIAIAYPGSIVIRQSVGFVPNPASQLLFVAAMVLAYAVQFLVRGPAFGFAFTGTQKVWRRHRVDGTSRVGWLILSSFLGALLFIATNAGLQILGIS